MKQTLTEKAMSEHFVDNDITEAYHSMLNPKEVVVEDKKEEITED